MYFSCTIHLDCHYNTTTSLTILPLQHYDVFDHEGWAKIIAFPEGLETSCCHTATSERRRIRLKADYIYIALRGVGDRATENVSI